MKPSYSSDRPSRMTSMCSTLEMETPMADRESIVFLIFKKVVANDFVILRCAKKKTKFLDGGPCVGGIRCG